MLHRLLDTNSGVEILSDDKWLPVYKGRAGVEYIGEYLGDVEETASEEVADIPSKKSKKK